MKEKYSFAYSAQGYNHIKASKICQDASGFYCDDDIAIAVVADGHGGDNYPRTDRGSQFAVEAALSAVREFAGTVLFNRVNLLDNADEHIGQLAKNILARWYDAVEDDLAVDPLVEDELAKVSDRYRKKYLSGQRCEKAYGTTLIAVCDMGECWIGLQIGDGKCVCIMPDGTVEEPIPWDDDCQSNVTTSICDSEAIDEFRYCLRREKPVASFIGTDGIDDSYASAEELHGLYRGILSIFAEHGREIGEEEI